MSLAKSKNDFSKKDMNFFSEFNGGASQNFSSAFPFFLLVALSMLVITIVIWVVCNFSIMKKTNRKNELQSIMASQQYKDQLAEKDKVQAKLDEMREYAYVLTTLQSKIVNMATSRVDTMKAVVDNLPNDTILTYYKDLDGTVEIHGSSLDRISPQNYLHLLEQSGLFDFTQSKIMPFDPVSNGYDKNSLMFGMMKYEFEFKCTLKGHFVITQTKFLDGANPQPLTEQVSYSCSVNEVKPLQNIKEVVDNGTTYTLTNIKINGTAVSSKVLEKVLSDDVLELTASSNQDVELYYSLPKTTTKDGGKTK